MDDEGDSGKPFAIPDLWAPSKLYLGGLIEDGLLFSQLQLDDIDEKLPAIADTTKKTDTYFNLPDYTLGDPIVVPVDIEPKSDPATSADGPGDEITKDVEGEDIWLGLGETGIPQDEANYLSWDAFENHHFRERHTPYITETGPTTFDAAIIAEEDFLKINNAGHVVVDTKTYTAALFALALGRSSVLFTWVEEKQTFDSAFPKMRISGYSGTLLENILVMFMECGNITVSLQKFVDKSYTAHASPGRIALANSVSQLLSKIQARFNANPSTQNSIMQLQALFQPTHSILKCFGHIIRHVSKSRSDESMLSTIYQEIQLLEHRTDSLRGILLEVLSQVSRPWLEFSGVWLGLERETTIPLTKEGKGKSFVKVENREWVDEQGLEVNEPDFVLDIDRVPAFISSEDARAMFEVGRSLRFLRDHHSDHPLARAEVIASACPPSLDWKFSWEDIVKVEGRALQYESDLTKAIQEFGKKSSEPAEEDTSLSQNLVASSSPLNFWSSQESGMEAQLLATIDMFNKPLGEDVQVDSFSEELNAYLRTSGDSVREDDSLFSPPISLVPVLSFNPIISAQARIVNGTCMRIFFKSHNLREHLSVQRSFHLLGNGVFSSRLSHALFDPELETAERQRGIARSGGTMGLRLGGRDTWPPASSELRLALMGVMTESYHTNNSPDAIHAGTFLDQTSMPGDLSFAVRDMSEEEIQKCMDPDSVEALDFLRLSYKPPAPLDAVITPVILYKYDQLFKLLLRVIRMLYVVSALFRDATDRTARWQGIENLAQRFRIEAHHFISSICGYFFDTGIETTWRLFERKLDQIEARINRDDGNISLGQNEGIDKLRDYHERVLDRIMFALLLRKRQQPVLNLLEEIFTLVLQFSKHSRQRATGSKRKDSADKEVRELYARFRKKVGVFISVCRSLSEKKGYGERKFIDGRAADQGGLFDFDDLTEENTISQLLSRLEMSNYYSKP
ncbi:hypothetical protein HYFRA_00001138 [Hymenoscyphus fraxineus]|uniref:Spindle pole body component n=1 Tax=Hymenoscyphus fraxineus TaxID=746836 RepID=A0A9N9KRW6_9HELO|nr:hypothetical protein HYFRA_00001138 [Hymenoscyphus fraxineus]